MAKGTPAQAAERYARRTAAAAPDWVNGVNQVTESPGAKAAASADLWQMKVSQQQAKEKFKRRTGAVSTEDWKTATAAAQSRYSQGAAAAQAKMEKYQAAVASHIEAGKRMIAAMPKGTPQDAAARASAWVLHMAKFEYKP
jgi:predicted component of type VI protein secretion system